MTSKRQTKAGCLLTVGDGHCDGFRVKKKCLEKISRWMREMSELSFKRRRVGESVGSRP